SYSFPSSKARTSEWIAGVSSRVRLSLALALGSPAEGLEAILPRHKNRFQARVQPLRLIKPASRADFSGAWPPLPWPHGSGRNRRPPGLSLQRHQLREPPARRVHEAV